MIKQPWQMRSPRHSYRLPPSLPLRAPFQTRAKKSSSPSSRTRSKAFRIGKPDSREFPGTSPSLPQEADLRSRELAAQATCLRPTWNTSHGTSQHSKTLERATGARKPDPALANATFYVRVPGRCGKHVQTRTLKPRGKKVPNASVKPLPYFAPFPRVLWERAPSYLLLCPQYPLPQIETSSEG